jgi:hypothetical protein
VVTGDIDAEAVEDLIILCVRYHRLRAETPAASPDGIGACKLAAVPCDAGADADDDPAIRPG